MKIQIDHLSVKIGNRRILSNITTDLFSGIYGVIGANGSGKTTFFRSLLGLQQYHGSIVMPEMRIGYLPQHFDTLRGLTVEESLEYFCCLKNIPLAESRQEIDMVMKQVHLHDEAGKKVSSLSGGMFQRLGIA